MSLLKHIIQLTKLVPKVNGLVLVVIFMLTIEFITARPQQQQQQIDPAYLRDYYAQQQNIAARGAAASNADATPIFEQNTSFQPQQSQPQYIASAQQFRARDSVQEQIRAQQQQQQPQQFNSPAARQYNQQPQQLQYQPQYQQQNIQYNRPASAAKQTLAIPRPRPQEIQSVHQGQRLNKEEVEEDYENSNPSYQFGFDVKDDEFTNYQNRKEVRDGNVIKGSYSVVDSDGFIRTVTYTADPKEGFKADVVREPTDIVVKVPTPAPADNSLRSHSLSRPQQHFLPQQPAQYRQAPRQQQQQQHQHQQQQQPLRQSIQAEQQQQYQYE